MIVKEFEFKRDFLKHTNYKNGYHVYTGMETVSDKAGDGLTGMETVSDKAGDGMSESVIKLLYRIYSESATGCQEMENLERIKQNN